MSRGSCVFVPPGTPGADAAFPPAARVWTVDKVWMGRYVSTPDGNSKNLTAGEIDAIAEADGGIAYFVEQAEGTPINSTVEDDKALARQAVKLAKRFGLPIECPFWYAVDTNPTGHMPAIIESFQVYRDLSEGWPVGAYIGSHGGEELLDLGLIDYFHIPSAASWSETSEPINGTTVVFGYRDGSGRVHNMYISPRASLRQHPSIPYAGTRIDPNDTLLATPMWFPGREPLDPQEDDMTPEEHQMLVDAAANSASAAGNAQACAYVLGTGKNEGLVDPIADEVEKRLGDGVPVTLDYDLLADKVADKLAERLRS